MLLIRGGELGDSVMPKSEGEAGVDDVAEAVGGLGGPVPEGFGDFGFVVAELPGGIGTEGIAESVSFLGGLGLFEDGRIAKLHVDLQQNETAEQEALLSRCFLLKEPLGGLVIGRIRVCRVEEEVCVGGENHEPER